MAIPLIAGLPWLAAIFTGIFASIVGVLTKWLTKRVAIFVAAIAVLLTVTTSFMAAAYALINALTVALPTGFAQAWGLFMPGNTAACIGAIVSAHVLRWAYDWQTKIIQLKLL